MNMLKFFYHFVWAAILILCAPLIPFFTKRRFYKRLSFGLPSNKPNKGSIWIHALSVGEVISAVPLVMGLIAKYPTRDIVFSVTTSQGMAIARDELEGKVNTLLYMPVDFWWCIRRVFNCIRPSIFILVETDIWPGLNYYLRKKGIKSILVNGRISPRTLNSYKKACFLARKLFKPFCLLLMQSDLDSRGLVEIGVEPSKIKTVGNFKFDRQWLPFEKEERKKWVKLFGFELEANVLVAGSTHQGEEKIILDVFIRLKPLFSNLHLIIAPRKIEQANDVLRLAESMQLQCVLRTKVDKETQETRRSEVIVLDTIGELDRVYGLGKVCIVGGSLVPFGGHNLLEPACFGCPVLFGPHTHNFVAMSEALIESGGGLRVQGDEDLFKSLKLLLSHPEARKKMGNAAKGYVESNRGALDRVIGHVGECLGTEDDDQGSRKNGG